MADRSAARSPARLRAALAAMQKQQARSRVSRALAARREPIAIIGIGCRFPGGADDPDSFWRLLRDGVDAIREVPPDRWPIDALLRSRPRRAGEAWPTRYGGFLDDVDRFDARFFRISPREAIAMDPQQRLLLEVAGRRSSTPAIDPTRLAGTADRRLRRH